MTIAERRYDIDWLRVIAIGLLLIYHIAIVFQPWGVFIGFIQSSTYWQSLWIPMALLNVWRIPLLFFVSGMGVCFAMKKRSWKQLIWERTQRIFIPFLFGMFFIVPLHVFLWQKYYTQEIRYLPNPGHLWFLGNIFIYVMVLSPLFFYLRRHESGRISRWLENLFGKPLGLLVIVLFFVLEAVLVNPVTFELYVMTWHGFFLGLLAFFFGFICIYSGSEFWHSVRKWRWMFLSLALILYIIRVIEFQLKSPNYLMAVESNLWIFAVFGFGYKYLNCPGKALSYLSQGAYPIYIVHMIFLYLGSYFILPMEIPVMMKFVMIIMTTGVGCIASYELAIRRVSFLRPLFGLRVKNKDKMALKIGDVKV